MNDALRPRSPRRPPLLWRGLVLRRLLVALFIGLAFAGSPKPTVALVIAFEGVAPASGDSNVGNNYVESGFNLFNPGTTDDARVFSQSIVCCNESGSDYYAWNNIESNNPIVLSTVSGNPFHLASLDVGSLKDLQDPAPTTFTIVGWQSNGGFVSTTVVDATSFVTLNLGWTSLTNVTFATINPNWTWHSAIDNLNVTELVPEPTTALLLACGLVGLGVRRRPH